MPKIQYKNTALFYTEKGSGSPVVLLHGFLENSNMWNETVEVLFKNHRVVCIDLPGHGKSESLAETHSMSAVAESVNYILTQISCTNYALIGHSMGGYISMAMADLFPQNITKLMLFFSSAAADGIEIKQNRDRAKKLVAQNKNTFLRLTLSGLFSLETLALYPNELEALVKEAQTMEIDAIVSCLEGMKNRPNRSELLNTLPFPVAFVSGKNDPVVPLESVLVQHKAKAVKNVTITPNGHLGYIEDRELSLAAIQDFLAS